MKEEGRTWGCSSDGRASALQAEGQEFDSLHLHQAFFGAEHEKSNLDSVTKFNRGAIRQMVCGANY